jgi:hypothetical protein
LKNPISQAPNNKSIPNPSAKGHCDLFALRGAVRL